MCGPSLTETSLCGAYLWLREAAAVYRECKYLGLNSALNGNEQTGSSVGIMANGRAEVRIPAGAGDFLFPNMSKLALGPTQPSVNG